MAVKENRGRNWVFICYPESLPEDWLSIIQDWHVPCLVSPLHDSDVNKDGELKKPHYHCLLEFAGTKSFSQVLDLIEPLHCTRPEQCQSIKGQVRYFIHVDNPEKYQYLKYDLLSLSGFDYEPYFKNTESSRHMIMRQMRSFILDNDIFYFSDLYEYADLNEPEWVELLDDSAAYVMNVFISEFRRKNYSKRVDKP